MRQAFAHELPQPAMYTFLGCGQHSLKQYKIELRKACMEGLREAGLEEDRHASDGAQGKFKAIDDRDHGMHMVRVFPRLSSAAACEEVCKGEVDAEDAKAVEAELLVDAVQARGTRNELEKMSLLGLAEFLGELLPVLVAGCSGRKRLARGEEPELLESRASDVVEDLQEAWKLGLSLLQVEAAAQRLTQETLAACLVLLGAMEAQPQSQESKGAKQLRQLRRKLEGLPVREVRGRTAAQEKKLEERLKPRRGRSKWLLLFC